MTSCADILRLVPRARLDELASEYAPTLQLERTDDELADAVGAKAGHRLLEMLAGLTDDELADICEELNLEPAELARLAAPPSSRADCVDGLRPCPYRSCRYHLDEGPTTACVLDVADEGGVILARVGDLLGVTHERVRQIEARALRRIESRARLLRLDDLCRPDSTPEGARCPASPSRPDPRQDPSKTEDPRT